MLVSHHCLRRVVRFVKVLPKGRILALIPLFFVTLFHLQWQKTENNCVETGFIQQTL